MVYTIAKRFTCQAAHHLSGLPADHHCGRNHGHTYTVEVILQSQTLKPEGWVRDYGDLARVRRSLKKWFDHHDVTDTVAQPTAELIAQYIFKTWRSRLPELVAVRVSESPDSWAEYRP